MDVRLLIIDPQEDFCNPDWGSLYVPGAEKDCERIATMIEKKNKTINKIYVTFDSHRQYQIFFPMFWLDENNKEVAPFIEITAADIKDGKFKPYDPNMYDWCLEYAEALESGGRYPLFIWPYHTLIGSPGWCMNPDILKSVFQWERNTYRTFNPITKGSNFKTEHYSAVKAEVEVPEDPSTQLNLKGLIEPLEEADVIVIGGQARSHCVANTVRDIMTGFSNPEYIKKIYLLEDGMSNVDGFEHLGDVFFDDFIKLGGNITTTDKFLE